MRDRFVFEVEVFDPSVGTHDGDGINGVIFQIYSGKKLVYQTTETVPKYCAFGGDAQCLVWVFAQQGNRWPSNVKIQKGSYTAAAIIYPKAGKTATWTFNFRIDE